MSARRPPSSPRRVRRQAPAREAGFTIIEVLVAALIVSLLGIAVATALITQTQVGSDLQLRSDAHLLVNADQDRLRGLTDQTLASLAGQGAVSRPVTANGKTYTVTSTVTLQNSSGVTCGSGTQSFHINSQASWTASYGGSADVATADSVLTRPVTGVITALVTDQVNNPIAGATVVATPTGSTPGSAQSATTDSTGCVVFAGLASGTYTASASASGYVDSADSSTHSTAVTVSASTPTTSDSFVLGLAGSIAATFQATSAGTNYPGQADGLSYVDGSLSYPATFTQATTTIAAHATSLLAGQTGVTTTTSLYPSYTGTASAPVYTNNYYTYAGQCSIQNPYASTAPTSGQATVKPATAATATVQEPFINLATTFTGFDGLLYLLARPVTPRDIVMSYTGSGCTDSYAASVATGTGGTTLLGLTYGSSAPTTGWLADPGQPYAPAGDLNVCVDVTVNGSLYHGSTTLNTATSMTAQNAVAVNVSSGGACTGITS